MAKVFNDLGLGTKAARLIRKDGAFNVKRKGEPSFSTVNLYLHLVRMPWGSFILLTLTAVTIINLVFATIYFKVGVNQFNGMTTGSAWVEFEECLFFSFQTFTTVGYGFLSPKSSIVSSIAALEAVTGLMVFAIITGLLYGRFAKPTAKVLFSKNMLVTPYQDIKSLQFRVVNRRKSVIMDLHCRVLVSFKDGKSRTYRNLDLERASVVLFPLNWTVVHPITETSPLYGKTAEDLANLDTEFIVVLKGYDDTFSQDVNTIRSYRHDEMVWNARFELMYEPGEDGSTILYVNKIDSYTDVV